MLKLSNAVAGCLIGDSGAEALASALAGNKHLETLELPGQGPNVVTCTHLSAVQLALG